MRPLRVRHCPVGAWDLCDIAAHWCPIMTYSRPCWFLLQILLLILLPGLLIQQYCRCSAADAATGIARDADAGPFGVQAVE